MDIEETHILGVLIPFVGHRQGRDRRFAIDALWTLLELGWAPAHALDKGLRETVHWHPGDESWWSSLYEKRHAGDRLCLRREV